MAAGWRLTLADFVETASVILEVEPEAIERLPGLAGAESALQAPFAEFGGEQPAASSAEQLGQRIADLAGPALGAIVRDPLAGRALANARRPRPPPPATGTTW